VNLSRDGNLIFSTSWDKTARIWSSEGDPISVLRGRYEQLEGAISPDGTYAFSRMSGGIGVLWPMPKTVYEWISGEQCPLPPLSHGYRAKFGNIVDPHA